MRGDEALLLDMLIAARKTQQFTTGMSRADFDANSMAQSAVVRELQVVGEAARLVSEATRTQNPAIPWAAIAGMRNRMIHEYFRLDLDVVWETIQQSVPALIRDLEALVPRDEG